MNILLIEENEFKKKKLYNFLIELQNIKNIDIASSYTSGITKCLSNNYDLLILDINCSDNPIVFDNSRLFNPDDNIVFFNNILSSKV